MNYIEWIKAIGLAICLIVKTDFGGDVAVRSELRHQLPGDIELCDSLPALYLSFQAFPDSTKIGGVYIVPWQNFPLSKPSKVNDALLPQISLITVTNYAIVYNENIGTLLNEDQKNLSNRLSFRLMELFDSLINQQLLIEESSLTTPNGLQLIRQKEYNNYIEQDVAVSGSKSSMLSAYESKSEGKIILRHVIPDMGAVKSQWILPKNFKRDSCLGKSDEQVLKILCEALSDLIANDSFDRRDIFNGAWNQAKNTLDENGCANDYVTNFYWDFFQRVIPYEDIQIADKQVTVITVYDIFGDYMQKLTPDELSDYMPAINEEVLKLPSEDIDNLPELLNLYKKYHKLARRNNGKWVDGNVVLGANPKVYEPSYDELLLCEVGTRIKSIKENSSSSEIKRVLKGKKGCPKTIKFKKFSVIHYDVMGSGRFFYIGSTEDVKFRLY